MTRLNGALLSFALVMLSPGRAAADYFLVNAEQLRSMLNGTRKLLLVDSRTPAEFEQAHLVPSASASRIVSRRAGSNS
jgi:hypothetical protein